MPQIEDILHIAFLSTLDIIAMLSNALYIYIIRRKTPKHLSSYSSLLLNIACVDFLASICSLMCTYCTRFYTPDGQNRVGYRGKVRESAHANEALDDNDLIAVLYWVFGYQIDRIWYTYREPIQIYTALHSFSGSIVLAYSGPCTLINVKFCHLSLAIHTNLVGQSVALLLFTFAYRLWVLETSDKRTEKREIWTRIQIVLIIFGVVNTIIFYLGASYDVPGFPHDYPYSAIALFGGITENLVPRSSLFSLLVISEAGFGAIIYFRGRLHRKIQTLRSTDRHDHQMIYRSLIAQMMLPAAYIPALSLWLLDLMGIVHSRTLQRAILVASSVFALASPLINMYYIPPYRKRDSLSCAVDSWACRCGTRPLILWLLDALEIVHSRTLQRTILVCTVLFPLVSPLINMYYIPPYRKTPLDLSAYAILLFNIACVDFFSAFCSFMCIIRILTFDDYFIFVHIGPCSLVNAQFCSFFLSGHVECVAQSVHLLLISFTYRLWMLSSKTVIELDSISRRLWTASATVLLLFLISTIVFYHSLTYDVPGFPKHHTISVLDLTGGLKENLFGRFSVFYVLSTFSIGLCTIFFIGRSHQLIYRSLTAQMLLPLSYSMSSALWLLHVFGVVRSQILQRTLYSACSLLPIDSSTHFVEKKLIYFTSLFAFVSPLINMYYIPPYRRYLKSLFSSRDKVVPINSSGDSKPSRI
ncbi:hypothetical protein PRIPAC_82610 [Pristionchus pacificus]|uniref:G protein-coupled receptor n=1 Tax=Pristionchus pacificus TaxID=54126 RepID=A0A2A6C464_PRIPA|nr:hypothetical protein PRIPAC_82610 [Pristionchus pacificus]|eukprot:PDM72920.1 G protein-coupled receptor [Pristionchus pacificus]